MWPCTDSIFILQYQTRSDVICSFLYEEINAYSVTQCYIMKYVHYVVINHIVVMESSLIIKSLDVIFMAFFPLPPKNWSHLNYGRHPGVSATHMVGWFDATHFDVITINHTSSWRSRKTHVISSWRVSTTLPQFATCKLR